MISLERRGSRFNYRAVGVVLSGNRVLLHKSENDSFCSLPGGRVELLEVASDALKPEMREELGIEAHIERLLWVVENLSTTPSQVIPPGGTVLPDVLSGFTWPLCTSRRIQRS